MPKFQAVPLHWLRSIRSCLALVACCLLMQVGAKAATFTVINNSNTGAGSLRQAITDANTLAGADNITFAIGSGVQTISLSTALPAITSPLTIDGTTQPGFAGTPIVVLKPAVNVFGITGLQIMSTNCLIKGLVINGFGDGIEITGPNTTNNTVQGCYIGVDVSGNAAAGNSDGININSGAADNIIGGTTTAARNIISGNSIQGIRIVDAVTINNTVRGNFIGTNAAGTADLGNNISGILIDQATNTMVGGTVAGSRNVISGNGNSGVHINDPGTQGTVVQGNYIGTNVSGNAAIGNTTAGVQISAAASSNTIGGTSVAARNIISGNGIGVWIHGTNTQGNTVQGNYIGTNASGTAALPNSTDGVNISNSSSGNTIGGSVQGSRNVISGNIGDGVAIDGVDTNFNVVYGNYIGTNYFGNYPLPNGANGVHISGGATSNSVGGPAQGVLTRNIISGNGANGVLMEGTDTQFNTVWGNYIGTNAAGTGAIGNTQSGALVDDNAQTNFVGSSGPGEGNRIAYNKLNGVTVLDSAANTVIRGNSIFSNVKLGIDLGNDGPTLNDAGDGDAGPNNLQNFPLITSVSQGGGNTTLNGTFSGLANTVYTLDFYRSATPDPSGFGEAEVYIGPHGVTTDGAGNAVFAFTFAGSFVGQYFTGTASTGGGDTSEFGRTSFTLSGRITTSGAVAIPGVTVTRNGGFAVTTNGAGYYTFFNVPVGNYLVVPSHPNYVFSPASRNVAISTANVSGQNFIGVLSGPNSISGRISLSNGTGLAGITVAIPGRPSVTTNGAGYFTFSSLPNGTYTMTPSGGGYIYTPTSRTVTLNNSNATGQNFVASTGYTVSGRVADSNGTGIPQVSVQLDNGPAVFTNAAGYYTIINVPNGVHTIAPFKLGLTFVPQSRQVTVNGANIANQNFTGQ